MTEQTAVQRIITGAIKNPELTHIDPLVAVTRATLGNDKVHVWEEVKKDMPELYLGGLRFEDDDTNTYKGYGTGPGRRLTKANFSINAIVTVPTGELRPKGWFREASASIQRIEAFAAEVEPLDEITYSQIPGWRLVYAGSIAGSPEARTAAHIYLHDMHNTGRNCAVGSITIHTGMPLGHGSLFYHGIGDQGLGERVINILNEHKSAAPTLNSEIEFFMPQLTNAAEYAARQFGAQFPKAQKLLIVGNP